MVKIYTFCYSQGASIKFISPLFILSLNLTPYDKIFFAWSEKGDKYVLLFIILAYLYDIKIYYLHELFPSYFYCH